MNPKFRNMSNEELAREVEMFADSVTPGEKGMKVGIEFMRLVAERLALSPLPDDASVESEREEIITETLTNVRDRLRPFSGRLDELIDQLQELKEEFTTDLLDDNLHSPLSESE